MRYKLVHKACACQRGIRVIFHLIICKTIYLIRKLCCAEYHITRTFETKYWTFLYARMINFNY